MKSNFSRRLVKIDFQQRHRGGPYRIARAVLVQQTEVADGYQGSAHHEIRLLVCVILSMFHLQFDPHCQCFLRLPECIRAVLTHGSREISGHADRGIQLPARRLEILLGSGWDTLQDLSKMKTPEIHYGRNCALIKKLIFSLITNIFARPSTF